MGDKRYQIHKPAVMNYLLFIYNTVVQKDKSIYQKDKSILAPQPKLMSGARCTIASSWIYFMFKTRLHFCMPMAIINCICNGNIILFIVIWLSILGESVESKEQENLISRYGQQFKLWMLEHRIIFVVWFIFPLVSITIYNFNYKHLFAKFIRIIKMKRNISTNFYSIVVLLFVMNNWNTAQNPINWLKYVVRVSIHALCWNASSSSLVIILVFYFRAHRTYTQLEFSFLYISAIS